MNQAAIAILYRPGCRQENIIARRGRDKGSRYHRQDRARDS